MQKITKGIKYEFTSNVWKYRSPTGWHFISLPVPLSKEIRQALKWQEEGWGRLKALAKIGNSEWQTAIWFDTKLNTYILPIKATVRAKEKIKDGDTKKATVWV